MSNDDASCGRITMAASLRGTLIAGVVRTAGDNIVELLDGAAPSEQTLDRTVWISEREVADGLGEALDELIDEFYERLAALGVMGQVYVASAAGLFDERQNCRARLYGSPTEKLNLQD